MDGSIYTDIDIHTHKMDYYSVIKKNKILLFATRMDLECIKLSEISQTEKNKYCIGSLTCGIQKIKRVIITKKKQTHRFRKQTSGYQ